MSIRQNLQKVNSAMRRAGLSKDIFTVLVIILVGFGSFGLGRLSVLEETKKVPKIELQPTGLVAEASLATESQGQYVASKSGSKYHLPWCSSASRIKESNKVWFDTKEEAERAGYDPASNCKGL